MKFGIKETPDGTFCLNCDKLVTKEAIFTEEFCAHCGKPLTKEALELYEKNVRKDQMLVIKTIEEAIKKHSIDKILADLKEELEQE